MITKLRLKNFKSWADTGEIRMAPITAFFGANSSGKTSILQMLLTLKQTAESADRNRVLHTGDDRSLVDLGTFSDIVHLHATDKSIRAEITWELPSDLEDIRYDSVALSAGQAVTFETEIEARNGNVVVKCFRYQHGDLSFGMSLSEQESLSLPEQEFVPLSEQRSQYVLTYSGYSPTKRRGRPFRNLPPPVKCYGFPDSIFDAYTNLDFLSLFVLQFERLMDRIDYIGPLREYPKRFYAASGERPSNVGERGQRAVEALLTRKPIGARKKGRRRVDITARVASSLKDMTVLESFDLRPVASGRKEHEVLVRTTGDATEVLLTHVGFGVSQILPLVVQAFYSDEGLVVVLEQPEIHLHPRVQSALADVLISAVKERKVQFLVESHSEHFLRRLQRRIADETISANDVAIYFCSLSGKSSQIERLTTDEYGNITNWPDGFFADELGELTEMAELEVKRKLRESQG